MSEAPERIWAYAGTFRMWRDHKTDRPHTQTEYVRADRIEGLQARVAELEANLAKAVEVMREAIRLSEQPHYGDRGDALDHCFDAIDVLRTTLAELTGGKDRAGRG